MFFQKEKEAEIQRDRRASETSEGEPEPDFKPVITLPEVEVSTNEEDEDVLAKFRAKLYRFFCNVEESPEWKVRTELSGGYVLIVRCF